MSGVNINAQGDSRSQRFEEWFRATFGSHLNDETPLTIASKALYGQPFGFTREDVQQLRGVAANTPGIGSAVHLRDIADRIEALLPPEE